MNGRLAGKRIRKEEREKVCVSDQAEETVQIP